MNIKKLKAYVRTVSQRHRQQQSAPAQPQYGMSGEEIIAAIISRVAEKNTNCSSWHIGLTHEPAECKACWKETEKENVGDWTQWQAASLSDAQYIERYFINDKGMEGGTDEASSPNKAVFVYIF